MRAYGEMGLVFRDCMEPENLPKDWIWFDHEPSDEELAEAFPGYLEAKKKREMLAYDVAIERFLDAGADMAGYYDPLGRIPNIDRACSYAGYPNPYQTESQSFVAWRAGVWQYVYQVKEDVEAELREQPTIEQLLAELPARVLPE